MGTQMEIKIKTLTPIWTGGVETGKMDRIHETGILGSLRWWYEAIMGRKDYQSTDSCIYDPEKENNGICDTCRIFGTTGWKRQFYLKIKENLIQPAWSSLPDILNIRPPDRQRGWFLPAGKFGSITLSLHGEKADEILNLLYFLEKWGMLGAKPQLGYGVFQIEEIKSDGKKPPPTNKNGDDLMPHLKQEFGFFRFRFQPPNPQWWTRLPGFERLLADRGASSALHQLYKNKMLPVAPILKNIWRFQQWTGDKRTEQNLFGSLLPERIRSKIAVSWAFAEKDTWEVRGWVWLPPNLQPAHHLRKILSNENLWCTALQVQEGRLTLEGMLKG